VLLPQLLLLGDDEVQLVLLVADARLSPRDRRLQFLPLGGLGLEEPVGAIEVDLAFGGLLFEVLVGQFEF
jgi:hypothetical protein